MKLDFSNILGGTRSWRTIAIVFLFTLFAFTVLATLNYHSSGRFEWLWWTSASVPMVAIPLVRHRGEKGALFSVWALSPLAILASYGVFLFCVVLLDLVLGIELYD